MKSSSMAVTRRLLWTLIRGERFLVGGWLLSLLAASLATLAVPVALRKVIDQGFGSDSVNLVFIGLGGIAFLLALTTAARLFFVSQLGDRVVSNMRKTLFRQLIERDMDFHHRHKSSELISRLGMDAEYLRTMVGMAFSSALRNILTSIGTTAMMFVTAPKLALVTLITVPLAVLPIVWANRKQRLLVKEMMDQMAKASSLALESLGAVRTVKEYVREAYEHDRYSGQINLVNMLARRKVFAQSMLAILAISLVFAAVILVLWLGALDVRGGRMSPGTLGQFLLYAVLGGLATTELLETWGLLQRCTGAVSRIAEVFQIETATPPTSGYRLHAIDRPDVQFEGVSFAYPNAPDVSVLNSVSFVAKAGECIAFIGPSGAGKSTLFSLLLGLYAPTEGRIMVNGVDIAKIELKSLRSQIAIVSQSPAMLAASVRENIRFGRLNASDVEVEAAARAANADVFINSLPKGYDEQIGERGIRLSGGQLQRIAIARAILKDAPILLLDEAMSALDAANEYGINQALRALMRGKTTLVIAHRLSTIVDADQIVVMAEGHIESVGSHEELLAQGGTYVDFAQLQEFRLVTKDALNNSLGDNSARFDG